MLWRFQLTNALKHLDTFFLKDTPFIAGHEISVADFQAVSELMQLEIVGDDTMYMSNKTLKAWVERVKAAAGSHLLPCLTDGFDQMKMIYENMRQSKL